MIDYDDHKGALRGFTFAPDVVRMLRTIPLGYATLPRCMSSHIKVENVLNPRLGILNEYYGLIVGHPRRLRTL